MKKSEKVFVGVGAGLILAMGAATVAIIINSKQPSDLALESVGVRINSDDLLTELKVGKYYLQNGTDEEYIEVYPDKTMCMFGYVLPDDATQEDRETMKLFTTRKYYALSDTGKSIGLSDKLYDRISPEYNNQIGYSYIDENCIVFVEGFGEKSNYIYHNE